MQNPSLSLKGPKNFSENGDAPNQGQRHPLILVPSDLKL